LRAKGIGDESTPPLTYTGPSEDGGVQVQRDGRRQTAPAGAPAGASRRERREAARRAARARKN
jgi:preprotein translocase subunit SecA